MRDKVCYECADLHPVPLKGKKKKKKKNTKINDNVKTVPNCHLLEAINLIVCICQSLHLAESPDENRQITSHFVMKFNYKILHFLMQSRLY